MKKLLLIWILLLGNLFLCLPVSAQERPLEDELYAGSACLMDGQSGRILYEKDGFTKKANASTTKILTCILALEQGSLSDTVTVSKRAAGQPPVLPLETEGKAADTVPGPEQTVLAREQLEGVLQELEVVLTPLEKKIFFAHLGGFDYQTIASTLQISPKSVDNALQRVRRKLRKAKS